MATIYSRGDWEPFFRDWNGLIIPGLTVLPDPFRVPILVEAEYPRIDPNTFSFLHGTFLADEFVADTTTAGEQLIVGAEWPAVPAESFLHGTFLGVDAVPVFALQPDLIAIQFAEPIPPTPTFVFSGFVPPDVFPQSVEQISITLREESIEGDIVLETCDIEIGLSAPSITLELHNA